VASAEVVEINGIYYNVVAKAKMAEVTENPDVYYSGKIVIPKSVSYKGVTCKVTAILEEAFSRCRNLTSVTIPTSVTTIEDAAFEGCTSLTSITIPNSVTSLGGGVFSNCYGLTSATIGNGVTSLGYDLFYGCYNLKSVIIGDGVTSIGNYAFNGCKSLTSITIPNSVTTIENEAFSGCISLESITIPDNVAYIGNSAFMGCTSLTSATIGNGVTSLGDYTFNKCTSLKTVIIGNSVTSIGYSTFYRCTGLTSVTIGNSVTSIGSDAFRECTSLKSVTIPNSVTSINSYAFRDCSSLISLTIGNRVTTIKYGTFRGCISLKTVNIPNNVEEIGGDAFYECKNLSTVGIGSGIKEIGDDAFAYCEELTDVYCFAEEVPETDEDAFEYSYIEYATLHVPAGSLDAYKATSPWSGFMNKVKITAKVKLNKSELSLEKGKTETLTPKFTPTSFPDQSVTWKSSNKSVATVTSSGKVKAVKAGTATITCTSTVTGAKATCKVTVVDGSVTLNKTEAILEKTKTMTLKATVTPESLTDKSVTWKSSNTAVATVTSAGKVKGVKAGTATITCTSNATGLSATCKVTVGYVKLDQTEAIVEKTKTMTLKATVYPSALEDKSVTWKSSNTAVATVSSSGKVKGIKAGKATITCTSKATGLSTTCKVTVGYVKLDQTEASVKKGKTVTLTATVYPSSLEDKSVTWKSSNTSVATVSSSGKVKGIKAGTVTITCTSVATGLKGTCTVTVLSTSGSRSLDGDDDDVTGIKNIDENAARIEPFDVYDMSGRKVLNQVTSLDGLPRGIYIVNGKKMLKK